MQPVQQVPGGGKVIDGFGNEGARDGHTIQGWPAIPATRNRYEAAEGDQVEDDGEALGKFAEFADFLFDSREEGGLEQMREVGQEAGQGGERHDD